MVNVTIPSWLTLDSRSSTPIHRQIDEGIKTAIATRRLRSSQQLPTVRSLAEQLGVHPNTVARSYASLVRDGVLYSQPGRGTFVASEERDLRPERAIRLDSIFTRSVVRALSLGFTLEQIEASFVTRLARFREDGENQSHLQSPPFSSLETPNVLRIMGSHDLALDLFASHFRRHSDTSLAVNHDGSIGGLMALAKGEAEIAGCHLLDEDSGEYNVPFVKRMLPGIPIAIVTLVGRDQGLIMPKGNPAGIQKLSDLTRPGLSLVRRQQGSGTRLLFEFLARTAGVDPASFNSQTPEAETHTAAAAAVAGGQADAALGIRAAARSFDLDFIPLWQERYDFVIPRRIWDSDAGAPLRETLASTEFQSAVLELSGYDTSRTGVVVALF